MRKRCLLPKLFFVTISLLHILPFISNVNAAPVWGDVLRFQQPDGEEVEVRIWGDEFYRVVESLDGYTLTRDPTTREICYASLASDGMRLESTGVRLGSVSAATLGLQKHIRISSEEVRRIVADLRGQEREREIDVLTRLNIPKRVPLSTGNVVGICLLVDFSDEIGTIPTSEVDDFCNQIGYSQNGNNGSVRDYFFDISDGNLTYTNWVPNAYYRAANPMTYYDDCTHDRAQELVLEALNDLEASGFDFSVYDSNGDLLIDAINVLYAGSTNCTHGQGLWPHYSSISFSADGVSASHYQMTDMDTALTIDTFCHENGHMVCDWPDLYDTDLDSGGIGKFCLMSYPASATNPVEPCAYLKFTAGWAEVYLLMDFQTGLVAPSNSNAIYKFEHPTLTSEFT